MRKPLIAGNWKMNLLYSKVPVYMEGLAQELKSSSWDASKVDVLLAVPAPFLALARECGEKLGFSIAAQNIHEKCDGAFTGEISAAMLKDMGVQWSLVGHSERRQYYNETHASVAAKAKLALERGLTPVICIGETLAERNAGRTQDVLRQQLEPVFAALSAYDSYVLAYEPVWAIGTGFTATEAQAQEAHFFIRELMRSTSTSLAEQVRVLYGGSVKSSNIKGLMQQKDIDGALVGGASIDPVEFAKIVAFG